MIIIIRFSFTHTHTQRERERERERFKQRRVFEIIVRRNKNEVVLSKNSSENSEKMSKEKQPTTLTNTSNNNGTTQTTTLRSHPVVASSSSVLVKPLPPTPVKRARRPLKDDDDDSKDFYGFRRYDFRFASVKDDDEEKKKTKRTKEQNHLNTCWETNELAQCARDISIATFASEAASDDDDFLYGKRWKKAVKARKGKLLEKTVRTFGAPKEKRGEIWYELSGARQFADVAKESYERLVERAEEEKSKVDDLRGAPMSVGNLEEIIDDKYVVFLLLPPTLILRTKPFNTVVAPQEPPPTSDPS